VLEQQVAEQGLGKRLRLLGAGLDERHETADGRRHDVRHATETTQFTRDLEAALLRVLRILGELTTHRVGACLSDPDLGDLGLRLRQLEENPKLRGELSGIGDSDG